MQGKTISIAMATYNGARFIGDQLESLARQTVLPSELVITDDDSSDGTADIVAAFAAKAPFPVRFEKNVERLGYRGNFMKAAGLCRSAIIAFCDQDDVWMPHKLENVLAPFDLDDTLLVFHNATVVDGNMQPFASLDHLGVPQAMSPPQSLDPFRFSLGFTLTFRRVLLSMQEFWPQSVDFQFPDKIEAHDQWFFFLASCMGTVGYIKEPQVLYRQHGGNVFGWGGGADSGLRHKIKNVLGTSVDGLIAREKACGARASILEHARDKLGEPYQGRAISAARGYRDLENFYRSRRQMYESGNIFFRLCKLAKLVKTHCYRPRNQWGVGSNALARDLVSLSFPWKLH